MHDRRLESSGMPLGFDDGGILQHLETKPCLAFGADTKDSLTCGHGEVLEITDGLFAGFQMPGLTIVTGSSNESHGRFL